MPKFPDEQLDDIGRIQGYSHGKHMVFVEAYGRQCSPFVPREQFSISGTRPITWSSNG